MKKSGNSTDGELFKPVIAAAKKYLPLLGEENGGEQIDNAERALNIEILKFMLDEFNTGEMHTLKDTQNFLHGLKNDGEYVFQTEDETTDPYAEFVSIRADAMDQAREEIRVAKEPGQKL